MREIKFRVWCKQVEEMHTVEKMGFNEDGLWYVEDKDHDSQPPYFVGSDDWTLMQYTGLKDKNGREIYEGDIVHTWEQDDHIPERDSGGGIIGYDRRDGFSQIGVVSFKGAWFTYETKKHLAGREEKIYAPLDFTNDLVVIGNIYENPELLEDGQNG